MLAEVKCLDEYELRHFTWPSQMLSKILADLNTAPGSFLIDVEFDIIIHFGFDINM